MKTNILSLLIALIANAAFAQNLQLGWGYTNGSTGADGANDLAIDAAGNTYVTGYFSGTVDFDKGPGTANLSSGNPNTKDAFVLKLDPQGNYLWAVRFGGTSNTDQEGTKIAVDQVGNIVVSGSSYGQLTLPGGVSYNGSTTNPAAFMVKLDSSGTALWSRVWGKITEEIIIEDFVIDPSNCIVAVGEFTGTIDFDPDTATTNLSSAGGLDFFVLKLAQNGNYMVANRSGNTNDDYAHGITMAANQYCVLGRFKGTVDFNWGSGVNNLMSSNSALDCFLLFTNQSLSFQDAKSFGGTLGALGRDIISVGNSFIYIVGLIAGVADLDPDPQNTWPFNNSNTQPFISKCDLAGNLIWAKTFSMQAGYVDMNGIGVNANGDATVIGETSEPIDVDPGSGVYTLNVTSSIQTFIVTLSSAGAFVNGFLFGGPISESLKALEVVGNNTTRYVGWYRGTVDIDPSSVVNMVTNAGFQDIIVMQHVTCATDTEFVAISACGSYQLNTGQLITQSGTYHDTLQTQLGCDSVLQINLTISPLPNTSLTWNGGTLALVAGNAANNHQWIDCTTSQPIPGATGLSYTPTANGTFAVVVDNGTCSDTSSCETLTNFSIAEGALIPIKVYPNPTSGLLHIDSDQAIEKIEVYDLLGREVIASGSETEVDLSTLSSGVYLVKVHLENEVHVRKVLKE
jgi:hypothetical protein